MSEEDMTVAGVAEVVREVFEGLAEGDMVPLDTLVRVANQHGYDVHPDDIRATFSDIGIPVDSGVTLRDMCVLVSRFPEECSGLDTETLSALWGSKQVNRADKNGVALVANSGSSSGLPTIGLAYFVLVTKSFVAGGISGGLAKTTIAPLDRIKILFQVSNQPFGFVSAFRQLQRVVVEDGMLALWRGNAATLARVLPYSGIQLMSFDQYSSIIRWYRGAPKKARLSPREKFLAGAAAGATSVAITYPLDVLRARMAVQHVHTEYRSLRHAASTMLQSEGARSMYHGLAPTMLGILPYAGLSFFTFHTLKQRVSDRTGHEVTGWQRMACGATAGIVGQTLTYPLDIARRRLQTHGFASRSKGFISVSDAHAHTHSSNPPFARDVLRNVWREEGFRGLFKGLSMNYVKGPIAVSISFTVYDVLKKKWDLVL